MLTYQELWKEWMFWEIVEEDIAGVQNMSDDEIVSAILNDLLRVRLEFTLERPHGLHWCELMRFLKTNRQKERVLEALCDARVQDLIIDCTEGEYKQFINLRSDRVTLQAAMDIAGVWYDGYEVPEGVVVLSLSERGAALIEELGVDDFAMRVAHEFITGEKMLP